MSQFFKSGGQSIGASDSASVLPTNIQDWFPLGLTDLISLQSNGLSRVFFNIAIEKHQFFGAQFSLLKLHWTELSATWEEGHGIFVFKPWNVSEHVLMMVEMIASGKWKDICRSQVIKVGGLYILASQELF